MIFGLPFGKKKKIGLALSGGGARAIAHIGAIKALLEAGFAIDAVAGTSGGALVGAMLAGGMGMEKMLEMARKLSWKHFFSLRLSKTGLVSSDEIQRFVWDQIGQKDFKDMEKPFVATATDIRSGERVALKEGDVGLAVRISCTFPWMYTPVRFKDRMLVDGCLTNNLPVKEVQSLGADFVIGVDVIPRAKLEIEPKNIVEVFDRSLDLLFIEQARRAAAEADFVVYPLTKAFTSLELNRADEMLVMGEEAMRKAIPLIRLKM